MAERSDHSSAANQRFYAALAELVARDALLRLSDLLAARDLALIDEFDPNSSLLVGSEETVVASTKAEMTELLTSLYALPVRLGFEWEDVSADSSGDVAWVYAKGRLLLAGSTGIERKPYRVSGVLQQSNRCWRWRLLHGSQPVHA
jgi:hypothetical protein